jgi:hypothetical protein
MSSPFQCAGSIIASCIGMAMRRRGGNACSFDPLPIARRLWQRERRTESVDDNGPQFSIATGQLQTAVGTVNNVRSQDLDNL